MTPPVAVKICGITRAGDARCAVSAGASYLGLIFAGGPRQVTQAQAREVVAASQGVPVIGVFGQQHPDEIVSLAQALGLAGAQLHGDHSDAVARAVREAGFAVWRVVRLRTEADLDGLLGHAAEADAVLVEPMVAGHLGGSGTALGESLGLAARRRLHAHRMVLAGGLRAETVGAAVTLVQPEVVDVSSGVEREPGIKDPQKVARFMEAVLGHTAIS